MSYEYLGPSSDVSVKAPASDKYEYLGEQPKQEYSFLQSRKEAGLGHLIQNPEKVVEAARGVGRTAKAATVGTIGSVMDLKNMLSGLLSSGLNKLTGEDLSEYVNAISGPNIGSQEIRSGIEGAIPSLKPRTPGEAKYEEAVELGSSLANPLMGEVQVGRALLGTAAGLGAKEAAKYLGGSEESQEIAKNISAILPLIVKGKITPTTNESKAIYEAGKKAGLTEEQLTPLLQTEKRIASISKHLNETPKRKAFVQSISDTIGDYYEKIKKSGRDVILSEENLSELKGKTSEFLKDLQQTVEPSPQKKAAIEYINKSIGNIGANTSAEQLINWWQDINAVAGDVKGAKKAINGLKPAITNAFRKENPELAKEFLSANNLWEKRSKFLNSLGWEKLESASKGTGTLKLLSNLAVGEFIGPKTMVAAMMSGPVLRKIGDKLLFDPNWQNITRTMSQSIVKESPKLASASVKLLKKKIADEMPDEYSEIDWSKIDNID